MSYDNSEFSKRVVFMVLFFMFIYLVILFFQYFFEMLNENKRLWKVNESLNEDLAYFMSEQEEIERDIKIGIKNLVTNLTPYDKNIEPKEEN